MVGVLPTLKLPVIFCGINRNILGEYKHALQIVYRKLSFGGFTDQR